MHFQIICSMLLVAALASVNAAEEPVASGVVPKFIQERSFVNYTIFTVLKYTTTSTSTLLFTTTCTTSTAALKTCTKSGGRKRRGLSIAAQQGRHRRGLFFDDDEIAQDGSIFLPSEKRSTDPVEEVQPSVVPSPDNLIPLDIQPGFSLPEGVNANRFLLNVGTRTVTSYTISTTTRSITAICQSTTGWSLCGASGK